MASSYQITINGQSFEAQRGELLLDAALSNGIDLPYNCRAGHCGTCCVRLVSGDVQGGEGSEPGIVHACQCRIDGDAVLEKDQSSGVRTVEGVLTSLRPVSSEVMEVGIKTDRALPYHAGQYAQLRFKGYPSRPFSMTHPLRGNPSLRSVWFHVRRTKDGRVTRSLGKDIRPGHRVKLTAPYGSAHFRPNTGSRLILVASNTGFAPIWSIAVAALQEDPERKMMVIAGGRTIETVHHYMSPALVQLARFPNVHIVPFCSTPQSVSRAVKPGRPTEYLPRLLPTDVLYACGAPEMVDSIKSIAAQADAPCYADPFLPTTDDTVEESVLSRAMGWLAAPARPEMGEFDLPDEEPMQMRRMAEARQLGQLALDRKRQEQPMPYGMAALRQMGPVVLDRPHNRWEQSMPAYGMAALRQTGTVPLDRPRNRQEQPTQAHRMAEVRQMGDSPYDPRNRWDQPMPAYRMAKQG